MVLPANATAKINEVSNRDTLIRWATPPENVTPKVEPKVEPEVIESKASSIAISESSLDVTVEGFQTLSSQVEVSTTTTDDLTKISGIGITMEAKLNKLGITSYAKLADTDPVVLDALPGSRGRGSDWVLAARQLVEK